jgi:hypothetical protein
MTYRLIYWKILRDIMCGNKTLAKSIIMGALKEITLFPFSPAVYKAIDECSCTISQEGFEIIFNLYIKDMFAHREDRHIENYDKFLNAIDSSLSTLLTMSMNHEFQKI